MPADIDQAPNLTQLPADYHDGPAGQPETWMGDRLPAGTLLNPFAGLGSAVKFVVTGEWVRNWLDERAAEQRPAAVPVAPNAEIQE